MCSRFQRRARKLSLKSRQLVVSALVLLPFYSNVLLHTPGPELPRRPKVLLAVTTYNHLDTTISLIQSISANDDDFDVVFFDDCSEDETVHFLQARGFDVYRHRRGVGTTALWNSAFAYARRRRYDIIVISNNDVLIPTGALQQLVETLRSSKIGAAVPLTSTRGAGFNPAQAIGSFTFSNGTTPFHFADLDFANNPVNYNSVQQTILKLRPKPKQKSPRKKFAGFFFALKVDDRVCHSDGSLIDPRLRIFGQEIDLGGRLYKLYGKAAQIVPTAFVYHYKSVTVSESGYRVGKWSEEFDLIETYHARPTKKTNTRSKTLQHVNLAFAFISSLQSVTGGHNDDTKEAHRLGSALQEKNNIKVSYLDSEKLWYQLPGIDILIVLHPAYNPSHICATKSSVVRVAWVLDGWSPVSSHNLGYYDAIIARGNTYARLSMIKFDAVCFRRCPVGTSNKKHVFRTQVHRFPGNGNASEFMKILEKLDSF